MTEETAILDLGPAARRVTSLLSGVSDDQLGAPTPCGTYAVGDLLDHFMGLTLGMRYAAQKAAGGPRPGRSSVDQLDPDWREALPERLAELAAAWREPAAWQGETEAGGITMPAEVMGIVALDELVIHGWDLARATGQEFDCDPRSTEAVIGLLTRSLKDRPKELFGEAVPVPEDAPPLDRAIGLSGRDPAWTA